MGDFIKELNIIDFLGMLLPGSVLLLLLSNDYSLDILWSNYFGVDCGTGVKTTILLVAGYVVGMLIHELGDITEKGLWSISWIDPKTYAAKKVGLDNIYNCLRDDKRQPTGQKYWLSGKVLAAFIVFTTIVIGTFLFVLINLRPRWFHYWIIVFLGLILKTWTGKIPNTSTKPNDKVLIICASNSMIQSRLVEKGNYRKRLVYDGFHVMMRNLLIVLAIVQFYIYFFSNKTGDLYVQLNKYAQNAEFCVFGIIIVVLMFVRYYHYSYLKYKYSFEDYILLRKNNCVKVNVTKGC